MKKSQSKPKKESRAQESRKASRKRKEPPPVASVAPDVLSPQEEPPAKKKHKAFSIHHTFPAVLKLSSSGSYFQDALSEQDQLLWRHKFAATAAVCGMFPFGTTRLLGVIRHTFSRTPKVTTKKRRSAELPQFGKDRPTCKQFKARQLAENEIQNGLIAGDHKSNRIQKIMAQWAAQPHDPPKEAPWSKLGSPMSVTGLSDYVPLESLRSHMQGDLAPVLDALLDLSDPRHNWKVPLVHAVPVLQGKELVIGVYADRLLPEITSSTLQVVMDHLDPKSYTISEPLRHVPQPEEPTFVSSEFPIVEFEKPQGDGTADDWVREASVQNSSRISAYSIDGLLKLLENDGCDLTSLAKLDLTGLQLPLMLHQKHAISWMYDMEHLGGLGVNSLVWEEREFPDGGKYYYSPALGQLRLDRPEATGGGMLTDEMGLGKTIEVLGLILGTLEETKQSSKGKGKTHSTLIVVPPALVSQWLAEIKKTAGDALTVDCLDDKTGEFLRDGRVWNRNLKRASHADIVLTTYDALGTAKKNTIAKRLHSEEWARIVLDEMQEIRSSTTAIAKTCEKLQCSRRWMLSGTPLFEGINDFKGELNFLKLEPFAAKTEDGFFQFLIADHWEGEEYAAIERLKVLSSVMLRRSKSMTIRATEEPILGLEPLHVDFVQVQQTQSERAVYYFLEYIVAMEMRLRKAGTDRTARTRESKSRNLCLRLLREVCNSAILINGGLGVASQLKDLNRLLIQHARQVQAVGTTAGTSTLNGNRTNTMDCEEAIVHLAQVQETVKTGENEVTDMALGFGQGISRRTRAVDMEDAEKKLDEFRKQLKAAEMECKEAKQRKAKALWYLALEKVTTGQVEVYPSSISPKYRSLWRWRSIICSNGTLPSLPGFLRRGWRVTDDFASSVHEKYPEFLWSHPNSYVLGPLPHSVSADDISNAILDTIGGYGGSRGLPGHLVSVLHTNSLSDDFWNASAIFSDKKHAYKFLDASKAGISLEFDEEHPRLDDWIAVAEEGYEEATRVYNMIPSELNRKRKKAAKRTLQRAQVGLQIVMPGRLERYRGDIVPLPGLKGLRSTKPVTEYLSNLAGLRTLVTTSSSEIVRLKRKIQLNVQATVSGPSSSLSAVESLEALMNGDDKMTQCVICLEALGTTEDDAVGDGPEENAKVTMTYCGHLFCRVCLEKYLNQTNRPHCPSCRKPITLPHGIVYIDPSKRESQEARCARMAKAKEFLEQASRELAKSDGQLAPEMWQALYTSIQAPEGVSDRLVNEVSALPRHFVAHLRGCTGVAVHAKNNLIPDSISSTSKCFSSKVRALLRDIPRDERSVVFSSSKATIHHLESVFGVLKIGCRTLCTGQHVGATKQAVHEWESGDHENIEFPVLLVQAGAAASGLTLTAANKMFFMEPFLRFSEEKQAYGRCHRYGQTKPVYVKCYYVPISVESRLLEWRKLTENEENDVTYKTVELDDEDLDQTKFLLGLHNHNDNAENLTYWDLSP